MQDLCLIIDGETSRILQVNYTEVHYIESQSLWLDITLLVRTVPAVLMGKGAD